MRRLVYSTSIAAVILAFAAAPASAAGPPELIWGPCPAPPAGTAVDPRQECSAVAAALDYRDPAGQTIMLAVSRIRTARPGLRRGVLLLIPGGPGSSGLYRPSSYAGRLPQQVLDRYDIIGFDPRGVGLSAPVSCHLVPDDIAPTHFKPWPAPGGDITANVARARRDAASCTRNGGPVLRHLSTRNEARDIDRIRRALGEPRLSYWGVSYGTYVGAVYATLYPDRTDRVVLDSNDDPDPQRVAQTWAANYAIGVADRFPDFASWAAAQDANYHLGTNPTAVRETFLRLAAQLDRAPLPWPGAPAPRLDGNALRDAALNAFYTNASFPQLASLMRGALTGQAPPAPPTPPQAVLQNTAAVAAGTICNDVAWPRSIPQYARAVAANRVAFPLTAGMPKNIFACAFWPHTPDEPPVRVSARGPSNMLLIQNLRDPATPYSGALRMRQALGDRARMVSVDSGGHGAYLANGNTCGDAAVTAFLAHGRWPARDTVCPES